MGRAVGPLFAAAKGGLWRASVDLAGTKSPSVGIMTGFFVPGGQPPAAETDGPVGAALLALGLARVGIPYRLVTDAPCASAVGAALAGAGLHDLLVDVVPLGGSLEPIIDAWRQAGIDWVIAIERCGQTRDGTMRNMRGEDLDGFATPLDGLFTAEPWRTIAIGDGGNEVGMGALPDGLIADHVAFGAVIACVTPASHLIVSGVSHWGAYALVAALAVLRPDWRGGLLSCLDPALDRAILDRMIAEGPAVDGVTLCQKPTIDGIDIARHHRKLLAVRDAAEAA